MTKTSWGVYRRKRIFEPILSPDLALSILFRTGDWILEIPAPISSRKSSDWKKADPTGGALNSEQQLKHRLPPKLETSVLREWTSLFYKENMASNILSPCWWLLVHGGTNSGSLSVCAPLNLTPVSLLFTRREPSGNQIICLCHRVMCFWATLEQGVKVHISAMHAQYSCRTRAFLEFGWCSVIFELAWNVSINHF